ncbi:MAG: hypothetical protein EOP34_02755 [Rickettsiales bacterium]|nr:MAG: hypothetical protein EOP34_02755 [Rickettsiales bacterium]
MRSCGGGDVFISTLRNHTGNTYLYLFSDFANHYTGNDPEVRLFCEQFRLREFDRAVICQTENIHGRVFISDSGVIPAIKRHYLTHAFGINCRIV